MITFSNPPGAPQPASRYSQAALVEGPGKRLVISGQVGVALDGTVPPGGKAQIAQALANLKAVLAAHGATTADIVKITVFLTETALVGAWRAARDAAMEGAAPTSTLLIVAGLADPRFVVEVEAEAFLPA
ncbi:RidA family protein [Roseococcus sp. YIM B11640]|uniref:RidA family protein n=1 Tax=Roseococcus sp. YIM B11640 TaxID=3133973 RepID=UPI003C7C4929